MPKTVFLVVKCIVPWITSVKQVCMTRQEAEIIAKNTSCWVVPIYADDWWRDCLVGEEV